jgi:predicted HicB family RNase H-like nuclease
MKENAVAEESITTSVRMSPVLHARLKTAADRQRRSVNNLIKVILEEWLDEHEGGN